MVDLIRINPADNVAVALRPLDEGTLARGTDFTLHINEKIPAGHKVAFDLIKKGDYVVKYGNPIGTASAEICKGFHIHTHNIKTALGDVLEYSYRPVKTDVLPTEKAYFNGFRRKDGKVGVRNEIWVIPTVGCVNNIASHLARAAEGFAGSEIDAVVAFPHPYGCSQMSDDQENTRKILADLITHPNAGGVLVLGLGCENSGIEVLKDYIGEYDENRVKFLKCQDSDDEISDGIELLKELTNYAKTFKREKISVSELVVGLKCGGSDGFSGITANPLVGRFSDILVSKGGTTILTEVPEMFGAEQLLMDRAANADVFNKIVALINGFKQYFTDHNQTIYENPSPGNKAGGISTLEDKSLGCTQKAGASLVRGVLDYGEKASQKGLNLLNSPGNDLVAATALAASGAQIILFTTGRGTPFASPVPTVKISSNSTIAEKKSNWIDFDAGVILDGETLDSLSGKLFDFVVETASGKPVKSEVAGFHDMAIFKNGVTL